MLGHLAFEVSCKFYQDRLGTAAITNNPKISVPLNNKILFLPQAIAPLQVGSEGPAKCRYSEIHADEFISTSLSSVLNKKSSGSPCAINSLMPWYSGDTHHFSTYFLAKTSRKAAPTLRHSRSAMLLPSRRRGQTAGKPPWQPACNQLCPAPQGERKPPSFHFCTLWKSISVCVKGILQPVSYTERGKEGKREDKRRKKNDLRRFAKLTFTKISAQRGTA